MKVEDDFKRCRACMAIKPRTCFYVEGRSPDGLMSRCSTCMLGQQVFTAFVQYLEQTDAK